VKNNGDAGDKGEQKLKKVLDVQSHRKNLIKIREELESIATICGFSDSSIYQMKVAVSEAVANAIEHGSPHGSESHIHVTIECDVDKLIIEIADEGVFKARLPVTDGRPSHRGRGIFLMTALMDQVSIIEEPSGTVVRLVKQKESGKDREQIPLESLV
jgi:anti-sigma regulatory factor (Ser/Thr protein kinase)